MPLTTQRKSDSFLTIAIIGLVLFGIVMIYSASAVMGYTTFGDEQYFVKRQIIWAILGGVGMALTANIDYRVWKKSAGIMLGLTLALLVGVFLFSAGAINGAHRWIYIGGQGFQPSELAKFTFLVYLSAWLTQRKSEIGSITKTFLPFAGIVAVLSVLMLMEPDLGTLSIMLAAAVAVYIVAGMTWKQVLVGLLVLTIALGGALAAPYRRNRIKTFLNPQSDTSGIAYHVKNITIALGSGGWFGRGFGESRQKLFFLPEPHTDSIFAVITEELGFLIASLLILAFAFVIYRGFRIAGRSPDFFAKLLATGITVWFAFQAFINLASMVHLVPLVGVPLPFVSYGGTSLVITLAAVGVLLNISRHTTDAQEPSNRLPSRSRRR